MPYIQKELRVKLEEPIKEINQIIWENFESSTGILSYLISVLIKELVKKGNYKRYCEVIGMLENTKMEIFRRLILHYENKKMKQNGDVFE